MILLIIMVSYNGIYEDGNSGRFWVLRDASAHFPYRSFTAIAGIVGNAGFLVRMRLRAPIEA